MGQPYSTLLFAWRGLDDTEESVAIPGEWTMIVQSIDAYANPLVVAQMFFEPNVEGETAVYFEWTGPDSPASKHWEGKIVLVNNSPLARSLFSVRSTDEPVDVTVSGVVLRGLPPVFAHT